MGKVVIAAAIDHRPGDAFPRHGDTELPQDAVVFERVLAMPRLFDQITAPAILPQEGGAFKAGEKKGGENAGFLCHPVRTRCPDRGSRALCVQAFRSNGKSGPAFQVH